MTEKRAALASAILPVALALVFTTVVLLLVGANPLEAYWNMLLVLQPYIARLSF